MVTVYLTPKQISSSVGPWEKTQLISDSTNVYLVFYVIKFILNKESVYVKPTPGLNFCSTETLRDRYFLEFKEDKTTRKEGIHN